MTKPSLSLITCYYECHDRAQGLIDHFSTFQSELTSETELIVVDDGSKSQKKLQAKGLDLINTRIIDDIPWNLAGAKNLGALLARADWLLFFDVDQHLTENGLRGILVSLPRLNTDYLYHFKVDNFYDYTVGRKLDVAPCNFLVHASAFRTFGMYDEDFAGHYGYEDLYLFHQWESKGKQRGMLGDEPCFRDVGFKTGGLTRDLSRNQALADHKLRSDEGNVKNMIRFRWVFL